MVDIQIVIFCPLTTGSPTLLQSAISDLTEFHSVLSEMKHTDKRTSPTILYAIILHLLKAQN